MGIATSLGLEDPGRTRQELGDGCGDLSRVGFECEMAGVKQAHGGLRDVAFEGFCARGEKKGSILAPHRKQWRPVGPEGSLELRIPLDVLALESLI
jgi:hypothetical protein